MNRTIYTIGVICGRFSAPWSDPTATCSNVQSCFEPAIAALCLSVHIRKRNTLLGLPVIGTTAFSASIVEDSLIMGSTPMQQTCCVIRYTNVACYGPGSKRDAQGRCGAPLAGPAS